MGRSPRTPIRFDDHWLAPQALDKAGLVRIHDAHANAARRADRVGFDLVELFAAHGFLLDSFLSPIANRRTDSYGGSLANRMRYPLEVAAATREAWPRQKPLSMRITGCDWVEGGITTEEVGIFASGTTHNRFRLRLRRHQSAGAACRRAGPVPRFGEALAKATRSRVAARFPPRQDRH